MSEPTCASCRFFLDSNPPMCRRFPPNRIEMAVVRREWWCGEYRPKIQPPNDETVTYNK